MEMEKRKEMECVVTYLLLLSVLYSVRGTEREGLEVECVAKNFRVSGFQA